MSATETCWVTPETPDPDVLRAAFDQVLGVSFSTDEMPIWEWFSGWFGANNNQMTFIVRTGDQIEGVAIADIPTAGTFSVLSFLAVRPEYRGNDRPVHRFRAGNPFL